VITYGDTQLEALGDATRRSILAHLRRGPLAVGRLAAEFPISRPAISQHLRILKEARLVINRADGNRRLYELNPEGLEALRTYFEQFWADALAAFKKKVETPRPQRRSEHGDR
jgi:DNA-binding transcriptional ArsR family regulator